MIQLAEVFAVALPGELWLVAGALIWPLGAWALTAVRDATGPTRARIFARTAATATLFAVVMLAVSAALLAMNGTARGFQALAAQLAAGVSLVGGLLCGAIAFAVRRTTRSARRPDQQDQDQVPSGRQRAGEAPPRVGEEDASPPER